MPIVGKQSIDIWSNAYVAAINELLICGDGVMENYTEKNLHHITNEAKSFR
jgi:hypothetical protein